LAVEFASGFAAEVDADAVVAVGLAVEFAAGFAADFDVDVEVVVAVVCPMTCNTAIKQITTVAIAIRFIGRFPLDLNVICRPMRALGAIGCCRRSEAFSIEPSATELPPYPADYSPNGEGNKITSVL